MRFLLPMDVPVPLKLAQNADVTSFDTDGPTLEQPLLDDSLGVRLHSRRTAREKGQSKLEDDTSDLVFRVSGPSQAAAPAVETGLSHRSGHIHANQASELLLSS